MPTHGNVLEFKGKLFIHINHTVFTLVLIRAPFQERQMVGGETNFVLDCPDQMVIDFSLPNLGLALKSGGQRLFVKFDAHSI